MTTVQTLGWGVLAWLMHHLPSPRDETRPYQPADWQARRTLRWYELEPSGKRLWNRVHDEDPKGKGKSPHASATAICEFRGPVVFDGWARQGDVYACARHGCRCGWEYPYEPGEPKGRPWGSPGLPSPWVQVAAVSEAQTANTWAALHAFLAANDGRLAEWLRLDAGRTLVYWRDRVDAKIERVTSSAASRTGQPITHAVMDEPQEWTPELRGPMLADTILENLTKLDGWAHFTGNAPVLGRGSVAEALSAPAARALHQAPHPSIEPREDMTRDELRPLVEEVYEGTPWTPVERILDDIEDRAAHPWRSSLRLFLNTPVGGGAERWLPEGAWERASLDGRPRDDLPIGVGVHRAFDGAAAAIVWAQRQPSSGGSDKLVVRHRLFEATSDGHVDTEAMRDHLRHLRAAYPRAQMRDPKTRWPIPGPAIAFDRMGFLESAETLDAEGVNLVDFPQGPAHMGPATTIAYEAIVTGRLAHDGDPAMAAQVAATDARTTERGTFIVPNRKPGSRPNHGAVAMVMAIAMATQDAPPSPGPKRPTAVGF